MPATWLYSGDMNTLDYGGAWYRQIRGTTRFHVVALTNMDDACGRDNEGRDTYDVTLCEVDVSNEEGLRDAMQSCGWDGIEKFSDFGKAEAMHSHGSKSPLWQESGNNGWKLVREAKRESRDLERDTTAYEKRMNTPVNKIGQTAREFAAGTSGLEAAIKRGAASGDPTSLLVQKIYRACDGRTLGGAIVNV